LKVKYYESKRTVSQKVLPNVLLVEYTHEYKEYHTKIYDNICSNTMIYKQYTV